jgi:hypothetical protein
MDWFCSIFTFMCSALQTTVCPFSFGHCIVCPSLKYYFWLPLWCFHSFLSSTTDYNEHDGCHIRKRNYLPFGRTWLGPFCCSSV